MVFLLWPPLFYTFVIIVMGLMLFLEPGRIVFLWIFLVIAIPIMIILNVISAFLHYNKQYYWITNKRVIYKRGFIGYRVMSIPHERISDVIISRTFLESIFGFGSVHIQSLAGQSSGTTTLGSEGVLLAVPEPEKLQELIFKLVKLKRKTEGLTF
ncbi:MAG: PH domain-containing protein [Candidatus Aenigmarchaeota archaeon]|nr:PH domain-containing protein [Candidatus Aenigmarchaeota archaeon]